MKLVINLFIITAALVASACAQTPVAAIQLPTYCAIGGAYNQLAGGNLWASAIVPVSNTLGLYESTTADLFPVKTVANGRTAYVFQSSIREGVHKVVHDDGKNMLLIGADGGYAFSQASAAAAGASGISASMTLTYVRHLSKSWAVMVPIRALYMSGLGGWNPIVEIGFTWKP